MRTMKSHIFTTEPTVWSRKNFLRKFAMPLLRRLDFRGNQYDDDDEEGEEGDDCCWMSSSFLSLTAKSSIGITTLGMSPPLVPLAGDEEEEEKYDDNETHLNEGKPGKRASIHRCQ